MLDLPDRRSSVKIRPVKFDVVGAITNVETIAAGPSVKVRSFLRKTFGRGPLAQAEGCRNSAASERQAATGRTVRSPRHWQTRFQNQELLGRTMKQPTKQFALCIENVGNEASLILGKVYRIIPDARAAKDDLVRIVDESGEDYLFDKTQFVFVDFPDAVRKKILAIERASYQGMQLSAQRTRRS